MAENEQHAKPTLQPFYKGFWRGRKFGPNGIERGVHRFSLGAVQRKPRSSAVSLGSLAVGNMLKVVKNWTEIAENERDAKPTLWPFYKDFGKGRKFGPNGIKTGMHKFFGQHCSGNQGLLQLVSGPWQWEICFEFWKIGRKWLKTSETQGPPFGHFMKSLKGAVNLGQMALKQACTNFFWSTLAETKGFCS